MDALRYFDPKDDHAIAWKSLPHLRKPAPSVLSHGEQAIHCQLL
jgi:hypothetical protein